MKRPSDGKQRDPERDETQVPGQWRAEIVSHMVNAENLVVDQAPSTTLEELVDDDPVDEPAEAKAQ